MYPFAVGGGGTRSSAPVFGAVGSAGFDNRDGQFLLGFNTAGQVPAGLGPANYQVTSVRLRVTDTAGGYAFDPTYDAASTYVTPATDADAGRPVEVHGVGFRNGYTSLSFAANDNAPPGYEESSAFGGMGERTRSAFPISFDATGSPVDVSNNVTDGRESFPWAVGAAPIATGQTVPADTNFTFNVDLSDPRRLAYFQQSLHGGSLGLIVSSLHPASQQNAAGAPNFYTKENAAQRPDLGSFVAGQLEVTYTLVPEPSAAAAVVLVGAGLLLRRRRRDR